MADGSHWQGLPRNLRAGILIVIAFIVITVTVLFVTGYPAVAPGILPGPQVSQVQLTPGEIEWIAAHPLIHICPDPTLPPFEFRDRNGEYTGIAADYLSLISSRTGLRFVADKQDNWSRCVNDIRLKKTDILGGVYVSDLRKDYLLYSDPYFRTPIVILTRSPGRSGLTLENFEGKRVATVEGFTTQKLLREKYPGIIIHSVSDTRTGLREVSLGVDDAFFGDLPTATYIIAEEGIPNLQVSGEYTPEEPYSFNLAYGVRKDWPELTGILNKGLSTITPAEREAAQKKYISLNLYPPVISLQILVSILAIAGLGVLIILVILTWNRSLKMAVREKTRQLSEELDERKRAEAALFRSEEKYRTLVEYLHVGVYQNHMDACGTFIWANKAMWEIYGYDSLEEFLKIPARDLYVFKEKRDELELALKKEGFVRDYEIQMMRRDGTQIWVSLTSRVRYSPEGSVDWIDGIVEDITDRKKAKDELIRANKNLLEAYGQLSRTKDELSQNYDNLNKSQKALDLARKKLNILNAVTFQDIRNAIFSLSGYFELIKDIAADEKLKVYLEKQNRLVGNVTESIKFAENYQNLGLTPPRWQDVRQTFYLGISHMKLLTISRQVNVDNLAIYADPLLESVFFTLAENVVIHGRNATKITLTYQKVPDGILLVFEDDGAGIPYERKANIFDRKYEDKRGMGLFLTREILGITGITIRETGTPGKGARFEIHMPEEVHRFGEKQ